MRPGPPPSIDDERVAGLIKTTLHTNPADGATHWSVRSVAAETGISKSSGVNWTAPGDASPAACGAGLGRRRRSRRASTPIVKPQTSHEGR